MMYDLFKPQIISVMCFLLGSLLLSDRFPADGISDSAGH